ncbi:unnamed protein product [Effrenium voratum]|uniref:SH3 domain-containing protein n=1 Tax=Effrenium voratum TaxID=2562239 RepID=A0AA36ILW3_9DINO|nr:unnamed protein product [Effrenium voratum]CAJ1389156.1 unnamed protein product [Effrenium voratum]CAJ1437755.1 unnamed protein product [Effrenium voratum]
MAYPFGKGKGRMGKARLAPDYSFQVMMRDYDSEERKRRIEARYSQQHAAPAAALLSTAAGPLWTRHPKAQDIKNGAAEPATVVDLQLPGESDGEEVDECPGDLQPSDAYDPLQRDYSAAALAAMEKRRQELLANPVQVEAPPAPAAHPAPQQPSQPVQPAQPEQPVQPEPALTRPVEAPFSGQLLRVVHAFDGRQYGEEYLVLRKDEAVVWLREEAGWCLGRRVEPNTRHTVGPEPSEGWFPPGFAKPP